jgi:uncharacterized protein YjeT (DUF2065 family)
MKLLFCLLGLVLVVEGLPYFAFPEKMKNWMKKIEELPNPHLRAMGFVAMCVGLVGCVLRVFPPAAYSHVRLGENPCAALPREKIPHF